MTSSNVMINIKNVTFKRHERAIFSDLSLSIEARKITAIMGPSGTGKTTLFRLMGGQLRPEQGHIEIDGQNVHQLNRGDLYALRRRLGVLFQSGALFTNLNVFDNVAFPLKEHTVLSQQMMHDIVLLKLEAVGLRGAAALMPAALSGGMARRVALARAIALDPQLVMYDEPFAGQDPISTAVLIKLIKELNESMEMTSVIVSHDVQQTAKIADYLYLIADGQVIAHGTPDELMHSQQADVHQFLQGEPDGPVPFHYPAPSVHKEFLVCN